MSVLTSRAYAKINLGLRLVRKREDGFHDIETVFYRVNIFDELVFEKSSTVVLTTLLADLPDDEHNLCVRAARLLQKAFKLRRGVKIILKKNIPISAGLGGGSSDAAATLRALATLWGVSVSEEQLLELALELGSDVPYFLNDGTAYATGRGEVLEYFKFDMPYWVVLVYPNLHISTGWAYGASRLTHRPHAISLKQILLEHIDEPHLLMNLIQNDFEPVVLRTHSVVADVKQALYHAGSGFAQMSGSGSAVFGLFSSQSSARDAVSALKKNYQVFLTPPNFTLRLSE